MRLRLIPIFAFLGLLMIFVAQPLIAQECTELIQQAFASLAEVCSELGDEAACVGNNATTDNAEVDFAVPGTIAALTDIELVSTTSSDGQDFGLAMLNTHGNVPLVLSETGIHYMLLGETTVENLTPSDNVFTPAEAITIQSFVNANVRSSPSTNGRVIGSAAPGTELQAYGLSADGEWFLALLESEGVWISRQVAGPSGDGDVNSLPTVRGTERTLMQSFKLTTAANTPDCVGTPPSMLLLQGPENFNSVVEVNGIEVRFTSTIVLRVTEENQLQLFVLEGGATTDNLPVPAGFTMFIPLGGDGLVSGDWTGMRPITGEERALLTPLQAMPHDNWYTAIEVPSAEEVSQLLASLNAGAVSQTTAGPAASGAGCEGFRPTSPLGQMGNREDQPFYWDGMAGATSYRVNIYNEGGSNVLTLEISSQTTTVQTNTTPNLIGDGETFSWDVVALVNGQVACTTGRATVVRDPVPIIIRNRGGGGGSGGTPTACPWTSC